MTILLSILTMLVLALAMAWVLGWASRAFKVETDPMVDRINDALPGANCGGCGYVGCMEYAEAVAGGKAAPDLCTVGGESVTRQVAEIAGVDVNPGWPQRPVVHCGANLEQRLKRNAYEGEPACAAANLVSGVQGCTYGCLGLGDCVRACAFNAIHVINGLATVDYDACVGCGACEQACPRHIISMVPFKRRQMLVVACSNQDRGKQVKEVCKVGCIGCTACQRNAGDVIRVSNNIPTIDYDRYDPESMDDIQLAVSKCPMKRLMFIGQNQQPTAAGDSEEPEVVTADFDTSVDRSEWRG